MKDKTSRPAAVPRSAIVGAGLMGQWHADAVRRIGGTVSAIVDRDRQRAAKLSRRYPGAGVASDFASIAADRLADVVHICTPPESHDSLTRQCLEAGMHSLVEKPLTPSSATTANLLDLAEARSLLLCPVHQFLFEPGFLRVQKAIEKMGRLLHVDTVTCSAGAGAGSDFDEIVAEILPGPLSLIVRLLGASIRTAKWLEVHATEGELRASTQIEDASVSILISMSGRPTMNMLRLIGERGTAHVELFHGFCVLERGHVSRTRKVAHPFLLGGATLYSATANLISRAARHEPAYPGLRELIDRFYKAVRTGGEPPISPAETLDVAVARDRIMTKMQRQSADP